MDQLRKAELVELCAAQNLDRSGTNEILRNRLAAAAKLKTNEAASAAKTEAATKAKTEAAAKAKAEAAEKAASAIKAESAARVESASTTANATTPTTGATTTLTTEANATLAEAMLHLLTKVQAGQDMQATQFARQLELAESSIKRARSTEQDGSGGSETGERYRSWMLTRERLIGTFNLPSPSPELLLFIRNFHFTHISDPEITEYFNKTIEVFNVIHIWVLSTSDHSSHIPHGIPDPFLHEFRVYLALMASLFYFHEFKETAREGGKRIGGVARTFFLSPTLLKEDMVSVRKQEGTDVITQLLMKDKTSMVSRGPKPTTTSGNGIPQPTPVVGSGCTKCKEKGIWFWGNHTTERCRVK